MCKFCVFAGTTEGRELTEYLSAQGADVTVCVATEYGQTLLPEAENLTVSARRLPPEEIAAMLEREKFDLVIDATHPYAASITRSVSGACTLTGTAYIRLLRPASDIPADAVCVPDGAAAADYLSGTEGKILLTVGSKELPLFAGIPDAAERLYPRVLPMPASLEACAGCGIPPAHILAMQGPFTEEMNTAMLRMTGAAWLVTKDGGDAGGFRAKAEAARKAGCRLLVIGRPVQRDGQTPARVYTLLAERFGLRRRPEVTIAGIGPGSIDAMTEQVHRSIAGADCLIGADRMLACAPAGKPAFSAIAPEKIAGCIREHPEYGRFTVLMSGDSGFFSGTRRLLPLLTDCAVEVLPGLSSLACLCAKLGTSYEDVYPFSLHGRGGSIAPALRNHARVFTLVGGDDGVSELCADLVRAGFGQARVSVGARLSYPDERVTVGTAEELAEKDFPSLSAVLIERPGPGPVVTHGLPDACFQRGGDAAGVVPMTKREVRSVALSMLELRADSVCWDIGAGTGSVSIEMALQAPQGQVYAVEKKESALALLAENIRGFAADNVTVVPGTAPEACAGLPAPTHVFIGGSSGNMREILLCVLAKNPHARITASAIALETAAELTRCLKEFPFTFSEVTCVNAAHSRAAGPYHLMTAQNPVYLFTMQEEDEKA